MKIEDAIKQLEYDKGMYEFNPMSGEELPMNSDCAHSAEALVLAIEALKKKVPTQVLLDDVKYSPARCPACRMVLSVRKADGTYGHPTGMLYCSNPDCHQKLRWDGIK